MSRGGEIKPGVFRVERAHVENRTRVLDEVKIVANRRLGRQREPDVGELGIVQDQAAPRWWPGQIREKIDSLVRMLDGP